MILGIDLGTTYSVGAYIDEEGEPKVITNMDGFETTPSVVYFEDVSSVVVGQVAKENIVIDPQNVISTVKNSMGERKTFKSSFGQEYTPEVISSFILKKIVGDAEKRLNTKIDDIIVTIPAYFTDSQRTATEDAVNIAGLNLVALINEPTAAALYFAFTSSIKYGNVMVYDLGGGTFDATIIRIEDGNVTVKSTGGLSKVGGRFFDEKIVDYITDIIEKKYDIDLEDDEYIDTYQDLFNKVEKAKIQLSSKEKTNIVIHSGDIKESITYTREQFEEIVKKLYKRTEYVVKKVLDDANLDPSDIDKIILVGGSSKIPYIEEHLEKYFERSVSHEVHPDLVVAQGAAIYGKQFDKDNTEKKTVCDVCSHSIGIVTIDPSSFKKINTIQIQRNTTIPARSKMPFKTVVANQEHIELTITEGEFKEVSDVVEISSSDILLPQNLPAGTKGFVSIELDKSQIVHVVLDIPSAEYKEEFSFERKSNLSDNEKNYISGIVADYCIS